jgi:hypothetical protein
LPQANGNKENHEFDSDLDLSEADREVSSDDEEDEDGAVNGADSGVVHTKKKQRPRASDLTMEPKRVLSDAKNEIRARLATKDAYPTADIMNNWIVEVWRNANKRKYGKKKPFELNDDIIKMVSRMNALTSVRDSKLHLIPKQLHGIPAHFRGHVKTKAKPLVEKHYKFRKGTGNEVENKEIYARLKSSDYAYVNVVSNLLR